MLLSHGPVTNGRYSPNDFLQLFYRAPKFGEFGIPLARSRCLVLGLPDGVKGGKRGPVCMGERMQVLLGRGDTAMPQALFNDLEIGATC
jgi:hypothetical protein